MAVAVFSQVLSSYGADRARAHVQAGLVDRIYAYLAPDNDSAQRNRQEWDVFDGLPLWGWLVCSNDQPGDVEKLRWCQERYNPAGWCLNLEAWMQHHPLETLLAGASELGVPLTASLAGASSSHTNYDYRALDRHGVEVDWQAYLDSGEGPPPDVAVSELHKASFVIGGWEYRHHWNGRYGWGKVGARTGNQAWFDSYRVPKTLNAKFGVGNREWGMTVTDRRLRNTSGATTGLLMGRAEYKRIRATLDTTRGADAKRTPQQWQHLAASARSPGARLRPVSVYLAESTSDATLQGIAAGAG